jgi:hypothetical protein
MQLKSLGTTIVTNRYRDQAGERQGRFCLSGSCHSHLWHKRAESVVQAVQLIWAWGFRGEPKERRAALLWRLPSKTQDVFACDRLGIARQIEIGAVLRAHSRSSAAGRFRPLRDFVGLESSIWKIQFSNSHNDGIGIFPLPRTRHLFV